MGAIERHVELLKAGMGRISSGSPEISFKNLGLRDCLAKNHCPILNSGYTPAQLVYGRSDYFSEIAHGEMKPADILSHEESVRGNI